MKTNLPFLFVFAMVACPCVFAGEMKAPIAAVRPHTLEKHGDVRVDPYYWLRGKEKPEVIQYLKAENAYYEAFMAPQKKLQQTIYRELKARLRDNDITVPFRKGEYEYSIKTKKELQYPLYLRKKWATKNSKEEVYLDQNALAKGSTFYSMTEPKVSENGKIAAFSVDKKGNGLYTLYFKDLSTGKLLDDQVNGTSGNYEWARDNKTIVYVKKNEQDQRERFVYAHLLGKKQDTLIYDEKDSGFDVGLSESLSGKFIEVTSRSRSEAEVMLLSKADPFSKPLILAPRQSKIDATVLDGEGKYYIRTNWNAVNFRLLEIDPENPEPEAWKEIVPARSETFLEKVLVFSKHIVLFEQTAGLSQIRIYDRLTKQFHEIPMKENAYRIWVGDNSKAQQSFVRFNYSSLTTPTSVIDLDLTTHRQTVRKVQKPSGSYSANDYRTQRLFAKAHDGAKVPISIVYHKDTKPSAKTPLLLFAYGAYGYLTPISFNPNVLSLLNRGFAFALVHVRGGSDLGYPWYLRGKLLEKKNSFTDFITSTELLHASGISSPAHTYATGESAGGLLLGAVINDRPELYKAVIAHVPFIDVLTDMLDPSLPLTTTEYQEWGNPNEKVYYDYIKSYSPYDNVKAQAYPHILMTAGLHDESVFYWEPAKMTAKLRAVKTDKNILLLKTEMQAGHAGSSGQLQELKDRARDYAFLLSFEGIQH